ncbi:hypothetical protein AG1IA_04923 [Rhizoctonia solani AG-1 IA]|uniref:Secreted protein n=1 Tax=Thanatephorus cucumeris (strain AG1-IA) TaxID=983506 RepID=L8WW39_THACA|nr:hypothetical protein AG1IA_04923 [Rhizoctonia solani AG-1 IA]
MVKTTILSDCRVLHSPRQRTARLLFLLHCACLTVIAEEYGPDANISIGFTLSFHHQFHRQCLNTALFRQLPTSRLLATRAHFRQRCVTTPILPISYLILLVIPHLSLGRNF